VRNLGYVAFIGGLLYLVSSWMIILKANIFVSWWYIPASSPLIFLASIATAAGAIMIDCPVEKEKINWFSGACLLISAISVYYISELRFIGVGYQKLGSFQMMTVMGLGGILCLAPVVRQFFFPFDIDQNYAFSRGAFLLLALSGAGVIVFGLMQDFPGFEITTLSLISLANVAIAVAALASRGWLIPALAVVLVVLECSMTGSFAIVAKAFNVIFLVSVLAKLAYLGFSLRQDVKKIV
jgi:hypothetical protein